MRNSDDEKISVIIPAYNAEQTIERCLYSVLKQTYQNLEIIVIDDGSSDGTRALLNAIQENEFRLVVIHKENGGAASARNVGLKVITGKYVTFLDADDFIEPEVYEKLHNAINELQLDIVSASIREIYNGNIVEERLSDFDCPIISGYDAICDMYSYEGGIRTVVWDKLYRREIIQGISFDEDSRYGEDTLFNCQAMLNCHRYGRIPYIGYTYDHRGSQVTGGGYNSACLCNIHVIEKMQDVINEKIYNNEKVEDCLMKYKITIYRQLFKAMVKTNSYSRIRDDYYYLREYAKSISSESLKNQLCIKHRIQWVLYLYAFKLYMDLDKLKN